jgi:hypothetical protein
MMYNDGKQDMVRDTVFPGDLKVHVNIINGYAPFFGGVSTGSANAVYAFRAFHAEKEGVVHPTFPIYRVDGLDSNGLPVYSVVPLDSKECSMFAHMTKRNVFSEGMTESDHFSFVEPGELHDILPINENAPLFGDVVLDMLKNEPQYSE